MSLLLLGSRRLASGGGALLSTSSSICCSSSRSTRFLSSSFHNRLATTGTRTLTSSSSKPPPRFEKTFKVAPKEPPSRLQTAIKNFLGPKPMPQRHTAAWYGEITLICTVFAITGSSTMLLVSCVTIWCADVVVVV